MNKILAVGRFFAYLIVAFVFAFPPAVEAQNTGSNNQPIFNHAALCAKDLNSTAEFYSKVIGLKRIANPFNDDKHVWFQIGNGLALHVIRGNCDGAHDISIHLCFSVASLPAFIDHLNKMHVRYGNWSGQAAKIETRPDGVHQIYLQDPDGYWIEINDAK